MNKREERRNFYKDIMRSKCRKMMDKFEDEAKEHNWIMQRFQEVNRKAMNMRKVRSNL